MSPVIFWKLKEVDSLLSSKTISLRLYWRFQFRLDFRLCSAPALWQKVLTVNGSEAAISSVLHCPPLNWKVGCSIHGHW